jgi:hypothetical protein
MSAENKLPVLVPPECRDELAKLSKAALMVCKVARVGLGNRADPRGNLGRVPG